TLDPVYVYFDVDERALLQYQQAARKRVGGSEPIPTVKEAKIPVYLGLSTESGFPHEGVVDFANNQVNTQTGTIQLRGVFANATRLFTPGLFTQMRVPISDKYQT